MDPPTPWTYNPRGWAEWLLSCLCSELSPITPAHPLSPYFPVPLNHPRVLPWTHSLLDLPSLPEYVDPRYPSRQCMRLLSRWITRWATDGWEWHGTRDKAPHTSPPILQVTTNEPQTPDTGHKKIKIRYLPMDKLNPPWHRDPDLLAHPLGIAPTADIPRNMVSNPGTPIYPKVPVCWEQKNKVLMLHQKIAHIPHTMIPPGFGWSRHSFTLPPTMRVLLKEIVTYSFTSEWPKWKWKFPLSLPASKELVLV